MRTAALTLCLSLICASTPAEVFAQIRAIKPVPGHSPATPAVGATLHSPLSASLPSSLSPSLSPSLSLLAPAVSAPALRLTATPAKITATVLPVAPLSLPSRLQAAQAVSATLQDTPVAAAPQAAARSFSLLTSEVLNERGDTLTVLPAPSSYEPHFPLKPAPRAPALAPALTPDKAKNVRRMLFGTAAMKSGMDTITLSVPLLALSVFGGISAVAGLVVVYGLAQAAFSAMSGGLADRFSARKVLAGAVLAQAALITTLIAVGAAGALSMGTLIPLYLLIGGVTGIIETSRRTIPTLLLGRDEAALNAYNAKLHIAYQIAGVSGALAAGTLIAFVGPLWSLALQPPAFALAAWFFWRVRHPLPEGRPVAGDGLRAKVAAYFRDIKAGAKIILADGRMRWVALAFVLPQIVHRVFENLLIPVFAKTVLEAPQTSAWMLTASNLGELLGAALLLKFATRFKGPTAWIKYGAVGLLLIWALATTTALPLLLPLILISSLTWAASDLSLRSEVQGTIAEKDQPRALSFLYGAFVLGSALVSLALGALIDALGTGLALYWICAGITALAVAVYFASRRLAR